MDKCKVTIIKLINLFFILLNLLIINFNFTLIVVITIIVTAIIKQFLNFKKSNTTDFFIFFNKNNEFK